MQGKTWAFICTAFGAVVTALGGWDSHLTTLLILMGLDFLAAWVLAGVFHKSKKSASGKLESRESLKGIFKKGMMLGLIFIGHRLDLAIGAEFIGDALTIAMIVHEVLSIIENAALMGVPIPSIITKAVGILNEKTKGAVGDDKSGD